jgi:hypothetical protein
MQCGTTKQGKEKGANVMRAILVGSTSDNVWSNPAVWNTGSVPASSNALNIRLDVSSTDNLGTAANPLVVNDVVGATTGLTHPSLAMDGFLHANNIRNLSDIIIDSDAGLTVRHNLVNVQSIEAHDGGFLSVGDNLVNVKTVGISFGSTVGVGHGIGNTAFTFGIGGGNLILNNPHGHSLGNLLNVGDGLGPAVIELGRLSFNAADFIPNSPGSLNGRLDLTENGHSVYQLKDVQELASGGMFTVGIDSKTGYDYVSYHR